MSSDVLGCGADANRITAIEAKKPQLKHVAKSARLGKGVVERMGRDKR